MPRKSKYGTITWDPMRANAAIRASGKTHREIESALFARGLRTRMASWFISGAAKKPSLSSFAEMVTALGMDDRPFREVVEAFYEWEQ